MMMKEVQSSKCGEESRWRYGRNNCGCPDIIDRGKDGHGSNGIHILIIRTRIEDLEMSDERQA